MDSNASQTADAALAIAVAAGDREALAAIFDRYAPRLLAFSQSMLHHRGDAEDCLQDIFILTATRISGLREPDRLRSWLFSIARHECLRRLDRRTREVLVDAVPEDNRSDRARSVADSPTGAILDDELAALLSDAIAGLADRDRLVLDLADRQGLSTDEVAAALSMSPSSAYKLLTRARATARKSIGALLVARTGRENCPELNALLDNWNGAMTPLLRKRVARHIEDCSLCQEQEKRVASPAALLGAGTAFAMPIPIGLRSHILDTAYDAQTRAIAMPPAGPWAGGWPPRSPNLVTGNVSGSSSSGSGGAGSARGGPRPGGRGPALAVAAAVIVLLLIGAFVAIGRPSVTPEAVRGSLPAVVSSLQDISSPSTPPGRSTTDAAATPSAVPPVLSTAPGTRTRTTAKSSGGSTAGTTRSTTAARTTTDPGTTDPGTTDPGTTDPGTTDPATTESTSTEPSAPTSRTSATTPRPTTSTTRSTSKSTTTTRPARTTTSTTRTTSSTKTTPTTTSSKVDTAPHITQMSVVCQYSKSTGANVPILAWATTNTRSVDLSIDNPGVVGSYGSGYSPSGSLELPPGGCDPSQGTQIYTLYAIGNGGPMAQRTINWDPPVTATTPAGGQQPTG